jgi:hypothetical protein
VSENADPEKVVDQVLEDLNKQATGSDVEPNIGTLVPEEGQVQDTVPDTPENTIASGDKQMTADEGSKGDTQSEKSEEPEEREEGEKNSEDKDMETSPDLVVVETYTENPPSEKTATQSIARRTRSARAVVSTSTVETPVKKTVKKPASYLPTRPKSTPPKKPALKRKAPPSESDSDYDVEHNVTDIGDSEEEASPKVSQNALTLATSGRKKIKARRSLRILVKHQWTTYLSTLSLVCKDGHMSTTEY